MSLTEYLGNIFAAIFALLFLITMGLMVFHLVKDEIIWLIEKLKERE